MHKRHPRTVRRHKRKLREDGYITDVRFIEGTAAYGSRVNKLPPYDEYNPNKVHVARRRQAWKEHKTFPRGWKVIEEEQGESYVSQSAVDAIVNGGWTTMTKISETDWTIEGSIYI